MRPPTGRQELAPALAAVSRGSGARPGGIANRPRSLWPAGVCGLAAALAVILTLGGPGLTVDEPLDVRPGRSYLKVLRQAGWHFLDRDVVTRVYRDNAEHPPLGRWLLGIASLAAEPVEILLQGRDPTDSYVLAGRLAPALAFGVLVYLVAATGIRRWGRAAGLSAAFAIIAMPRVFAHAHFGALDTFLALTWTAAVLAADRALRSPHPVRNMAAAGIVWALALLTKIHGWFLAPIVGVYALRMLPVRRALPAVAAWVAVGVVLYAAGWPWLWYDTGPRIAAYLGTGVDRIVIHVTYFGRVHADRDVPWHYPWLYFAATVPVGLHLLGAVGAIRGIKARRDEPLPLLLLGSILFFLVLFSTRIPVYDGERLFLHVFPAWALLIGLGFSTVYERLASRRALRKGLVALLLLQAAGLVATYPFGLSFYNVLVGGPAGAERLGLEVTYWSDAVDGVLLDRLARDGKTDDTAALVPTLYPGQGAITTGYHRALARRGIVLRDQEGAGNSEWVVVSHRRAYWPEPWVERMRSGGGRLVATRSRFGVVLSSLWHFPREGTGPDPAGGNASGRTSKDIDR